MKSNLLLTLLCCWGIHLALIAQTSPFTLEQILSAPFPSHLIAQHNGSRIAWVYNQQGSRNLWLAEQAGGKARQVTNYPGDNGQEIGQTDFTPDGLNLMYVRGGAPNRAGESPNPALIPEGVKQEIWIVPIAGGTPRKLADGGNFLLAPDGKSVLFLKRGQVWSVGLEAGAKEQSLFTIRGAAGDLAWSPNGKQLAFVSNRGDHSFIGIYDLTQKTIQYLQPSVDLDNNPVWSPDGKQIAFLRIPNSKLVLIFEPKRSAEPWSIQVADVATGTVKEVWTAPSGKGSAFNAISADNQLFWTADNTLVFPWEGDGWLHLYALAPGGGTPRLLTPGNFEVQYVSTSPDNKQLLFSSNQDDIDRQHLWQLTPSSGKLSALTSGTGIEWTPVMTGSGAVACLASDARTPAHAAYLGVGGVVNALAPETMPKNFPSDALVTPEAITITATDGMRIPGQLFLPKNSKPGEKHPALLFFHGGSRRQMLLGFHHMEYYHSTYAMNQYLASLGYVVVAVNYRSGIGYGMEFREALNFGATGASEYNDVVGAGLYLKNRADVDPKRIGLYGGSYGGYLTALGLSRASDLFAAGVDIHGVHDWNTGIKNFIPSYNAEAHPEASKLAFQSSPMNFVDGWHSPVLFIHGDDDRNVAFSETVDLIEMLRKRNVVMEQLIFPDEIHGFLLQRSWLAAFKATSDFFGRKLK